MISKTVAVLAPHVLGVDVSPVELLTTELTLKVALLLAFTSVARSVLTIGQQYPANPALETLREAFMGVGTVLWKGVSVEAG